MRLHELVLALVGIMIPPASFASGPPPFQVKLQVNKTSDNLSNTEVFSREETSRVVIYVVEAEKPQLEALVDEIRVAKKGLSSKGRKTCAFFARKYDLGRDFIRISSRQIFKPGAKKALLGGIRQIYLTHEARVRNHIQNQKSLRKALASCIATRCSQSADLPQFLLATDRSIGINNKLAEELADSASNLQ